MTKPLNPEIKALRAINRALSDLSDEEVHRVLEWTLARYLRRTWTHLPKPIGGGWKRAA